MICLFFLLIFTSYNKLILESHVILYVF
jgi:hypothetical protein